MRLRGQAVKTSPFHGGNTGSIPVGVILKILHILQEFSYNKIWRSSQAVRQWSATPVSTGSNPVCASQKPGKLFFWLFLLYFIGKTAYGTLLNGKGPARRRAQQADECWFRRYKNLLHQNRHQVHHHLRNNPYPEVHPRS